MARPTIFTEETVRKLEEAFALGCTDEEACIFADIGESTLYAHQQEDSAFLERKRLLRHTPVLKARIAFVRGVENNPSLALKYLERKKKDEFGLQFKAVPVVESEEAPNNLFQTDEILQRLMGEIDERLKKLKIG